MPIPAILLWIWNNKKLIGILLAFGAVFFAGYETRVKLDDADRAIQLAADAKAQKEAQAAADAQATAWEKKLATLRAANRALTGRLRDETKNAVYSACIVPDSGVHIFNDALSGNTAGEPGSGLP